MYLGNPLLPINFSASAAADSIKKELAKREWHEYELKPLVLNLVPYFLFNYHYYLEHDGEGKKIIKKATHGILVIDGHSVIVREDLVELIKNNWKKGSPLVPKGAFDQKWCNIEKREQDSVLILKTAAHFGVPKDNVVISAARKYYFPFYKTSVVAGEVEYKLIFNAIDGTIEGINSVPQREKGYLEITRETVNELKDPSNWLKYSKDAIVDSFGVISSGGKTLRHKANTKSAQKTLRAFESRVILILIIILAIIVLVFSVFRV